MCSTADGTGIMFLNETVLGKEHHITKDDWRLTAPPKGFDSIIAKGRTEPGMYGINSLLLDVAFNLGHTYLSKVGIAQMYVYSAILS